MLCIAALLLSGSVLAGLITFADIPLYSYTDTAAWGLTLLEDQQLAGAIM